MICLVIALTLLLITHLYFGKKAINELAKDFVQEWRELERHNQ